VFVRQGFEPDRAEEGFVRFHQQDGRREAAVVEAAAEMHARLDGDHVVVGR